jgi:hypothetical protein
LEEPLNDPIRRVRTAEFSAILFTTGDGDERREEHYELPFLRQSLGADGPGLVGRL